MHLSRLGLCGYYKKPLGISCLIKGMLIFVGGGAIAGEKLINVATFIFLTPLKIWDLWWCADHLNSNCFSSGFETSTQKWRALEELSCLTDSICEFILVSVTMLGKSLELMSRSSHDCTGLPPSKSSPYSSSLESSPIVEFLNTLLQITTRNRSLN